MPDKGRYRSYESKRTLKLRKFLALALIFLIASFGAAHAVNCSTAAGGTPQTAAQLTTNMADNGAPGNITPGCFRDIVASTMNGQFNVLDYGAKCDGSTDDTTAIGTANTAVTATTGRLQFPYGTCVFSQMTINTDVYYTGQGRDTTVLLQKAGSNETFLIGANWATLTGTNATTGIGGF